jgi:vacuolar-type H+-ATPase subunit E/Vma4
MMIPFGDDRYKTPSYKEYKAERFKKTRDKVQMICRGIKDSSLKLEDKKKLLSEMKEIIENQLINI